jgi:gamma-glutamyltranspeptidase/glutathione hydrolase
MKRILYTFLLIVCVTTGWAQASPPKAAVATAHPLATQAGVEILQAGGNAFDAAVAITAAIGVVEPYGSGLGGGGFWLLHRQADGREVMVDGREKAPGRATRDMYLDAKGEFIPQASINGPLAAGIPGVPAAMAHLAHKYGRLPLPQSLAPAIRIAREGFAVDDHYQRFAKMRLKVLRAHDATAKIFLYHNDVPPLGYLLKQPDLAKTLQAIAADGAEDFYRGRLARKLASGVQAAGGIWDAADLRAYQVVERAPIVGSYRGMKITSASPPSSGGIVLVSMLNMLANFDLAAMSRVDAAHVTIEAMRRAYRDRAEYLGDPDFVRMPIQRLTSPAYAKQLAASISLEEATPSADLKPVAAGAGGGHNTTHFSVLDKEGNRVAATLSVNYPFGSCFVVPGTGFLLNDEMDDFSAKPGAPNAYGLVGAEANAIAPGKRPLSSMSPTFLESQRGVAILGTPGGSRIITMVLLGALEFARGGDARAMVDRPRFHHQYLPDRVTYEDNAFTPEERQELTLRGHVLSEPSGRFRYGNMQAIVWDQQKQAVSAASDRRGIGKAEVF